MVARGFVQNGVIVLADGARLPEGQEVTVFVARQVDALSPPIQPGDEWERRLLTAATDCGVALSHEALSSEGLYE